MHTIIVIQTALSTNHKYMLEKLTEYNTSICPDFVSTWYDIMYIGINLALWTQLHTNSVVEVLFLHHLYNFIHSRSVIWRSKETPRHLEFDDRMNLPTFRHVFVEIRGQDSTKNWSMTLISAINRIKLWYTCDSFQILQK